MRRIIPVALALATVVGLATPALAEETTTTTAPAPERTAPDRPIHLTCHTVEVDDHKPAIHCEWNAIDGASAYRVVRLARRGNRGIVTARKTEETSFTLKSPAPGKYVFTVQALGEDGKAMARSNAERVLVERPAATTARPGVDRQA
ncbi:MAG: hypothetical protein JWO68_579 [Actinomycetia bacterium]|nr:hypothetical protein [Actinomycetes bacterium]